MDELRAIDRQTPGWTNIFNAMNEPNGQRSIYRQGMTASIKVVPAILEVLAAANHIRWVKRGIGIDMFVLLPAPPDDE